MPPHKSDFSQDKTTGLSGYLFKRADWLLDVPLDLEANEILSRYRSSTLTYFVPIAIAIVVYILLDSGKC